MGDFNNIKDAREKKGGAPVDAQACRRFTNNIESCGLIDMGYLGSRFTWKGGIRESRKRVFKRLDRGLANPIWRLVNPEAKLEVLTRINSDHHPLCLTTNPDRVDRGHKLSCFEVM